MYNSSDLFLLNSIHILHTLKRWLKIELNELDELSNMLIHYFNSNINKNNAEYKIISKIDRYKTIYNNLLDLKKDNSYVYDDKYIVNDFYSNIEQYIIEKNDNVLHKFKTTSGAPIEIHIMLKLKSGNISLKFKQTGIEYFNQTKNNFGLLSYYTLKCKYPAIFDEFLNIIKEELYYNKEDNILYNFFKDDNWEFDLLR